MPHLGIAIQLEMQEQDYENVTENKCRKSEI